MSNPSDRLNEAATKGDTQQGFPIERTFTEWRYSKYYDTTVDGGGEGRRCWQRRAATADTARHAARARQADTHANS